VDATEDPVKEEAEEEEEVAEWGLKDWVPKVSAELSRLDSMQWAQKKRDTILAIVDARLGGLSEETVWGRSDTCSRNTYHSKWKKDDIFASVLTNVEKLARSMRDNRALYALQNAVERLALATPNAVARLIEVMAQAGDLTNARLAATAILDRAGMETAAKSRVDVQDADGLTVATGVDEKIKKVYG